MNQYQNYRVTTWEGDLVDEVYTCSAKFAAMIAFDLYREEFPNITNWADLKVEALGNGS